MKAKRLPSVFEICLLVVSIVLFLLLLDFRSWRWQGNYGDTLYFQEIAQSLGRGLWFRSHFGGSVGVDFAHVVWNPNANSLGQIPNFPLVSQPSQFYNHAYLIMIPIAALTLLIHYRVVIDSLMVILTLAPFMMVILVLGKGYTKILRRKMVLLGLLSVVILLCFPGINYIALGQFYPDRLIILFLPLTMLSIEKLGSVSNRRAIVTFTILAGLSMSVTERGSLYVALVALGIPSFRILRNRRNLDQTLGKNIPILWVGLAAFAWSVIFIKRISQNNDTSNSSPSILNISLAHSPLFTMTSLKLILLCLPLLIVALRYVDLLVIGVLALLPNLLGTYMFNLRTAWFAHYMSYLSATLIGVFLIALRRDLQRPESSLVPGRLRQVIPLLVIVASGMSVLSAYLINPVTETTLVEPTSQIRLGTFTEAKSWWTNPSYRQVTKQVVKGDYDLASEIPADSSVVVTELTAPFVGGKVKYVDYYPTNIEVDDYVLIFSNNPVDQPFYASSVTNYASAQASQIMTAEVTQLLNSDCYEIVNRNVNSNLYLFHRIREIPSISVCHARNG